MILSGRPHLGEELLPEDFGWRFVAKAFSRRGVQALADLLQLLISEGEGIDISREPFSDPPVRVFDSAFLLGRLRVAEPGLGPDPGLEIRPVSELGAAIEGDRAACAMGQGAHHADQPLHDRPLATTRSAMEEGQAIRSEPVGFDKLYCTV